MPVWVSWIVEFVLKGFGLASKPTGPTNEVLQARELGAAEQALQQEKTTDATLARAAGAPTVPLDPDSLRALGPDSRD